DVVVDVVEVDVRHVHCEPRRHRLALEILQGAEAELAHPVGLALHLRHLVDDLDVDALLGLEDVVLDVAPAELVTAEIEIGGRHQAISSCYRGFGWVGGISPTQIVTTTGCKHPGDTKASRDGSGLDVAEPGEAP